MSYKANNRDREVVKSLAGIGLDAGEIALILNVGPADLKAAYSQEMVSGPAEGRAKVMTALYKKAMSGDVGAIDLWRRMQGNFYS